MKWKVKARPVKGDTRIRTKFAWTPTFVYKDTEVYKVWLETYRVTEEYTKTYVNSDNGYYYCRRVWKVVKREPLFGEHE